MVSFFKRKTSRAFTIVELLVVIVVIGTLAGVVAVGYNAVVTNAKDTALKSELSDAQEKLEAYFRQNRTYPDSNGLDEAGISSTDAITYTYTSDGGTYCITATSLQTQHSSHINSTVNRIQDGACV